ncbi:MAG: cytoplasmic filament protein CfpA, partial [Spirochaetota bacterium]|nr:cytoplasmic filament protein CfpA [Spirochaetota bacterium]
KYMDLDELTLQREAYDRQIGEFNREIGEVRDVVNAIYHNRKRIWSVRDFDDLFRKVKRDIKKLKRLSDPDYEDEGSYLSQDWGGIQHIRPEESEIERENKTFIHEHYYQKNRLSQIEKRIEKVYQRDYPTERAILDRRLKFLKEKYLDFSHRINPHHIQPGLILDIDIVSIKKKRITLNRMANVLGEFLAGISRGFQDWGNTDMLSLKSAVREEISRGFINN